MQFACVCTFKIKREILLRVDKKKDVTNIKGLDMGESMWTTDLGIESLWNHDNNLIYQAVNGCYPLHYSFGAVIGKFSKPPNMLVWHFLRFNFAKLKLSTCMPMIPSIQDHQI